MIFCYDGDIVYSEDRFLLFKTKRCPMNKIHTLLMACLIFSFLQGCSFIVTYYNALPDKNTPYYTHSLGMNIYNSSGDFMSEKEWKNVFTDINAYYERFKDIIADDFNEIAYKKLGYHAIILLPPHPMHDIFGRSHSAFVDFKSMFIRRDKVSFYLNLIGKGLWGNIAHNDKLFRKYPIGEAGD